VVRRAAVLLFVVAAFGVALYMSIRTLGSASSQGSSSKDEILLVCEQCGNVVKLTSGQMLDTPREGGAYKCSKCGAFRMVHGTVPCAKCGKHLPFNPGLTNCPWCKAPLGSDAPGPSGS